MAIQSAIPVSLEAFFPRGAFVVVKSSRSSSGPTMARGRVKTSTRTPVTRCGRSATLTPTPTRGRAGARSRSRSPASRSLSFRRS